MAVAYKSKQTGAEHRRPFVLEEFAPYCIVVLGHAISGKLSNAYADENLTVPEWRVLAVVAQADAIAARDVVRQTPMDKMTVSRAVASLESKGFVNRAPDTRDKRVSTLSLSKEGRIIFERVAALAVTFEDEMLSALDANERRQFTATLSKLERKVRAMHDT